MDPGFPFFNGTGEGRVPGIYPKPLNRVPGLGPVGISSLTCFQGNVIQKYNPDDCFLINNGYRGMDVQPGAQWAC